MIIFAWLCLAAVAGFVTLGSVVLLYASIGVTGKIGGECWVFVVVSALLCYIAYANFPFILELKP